MFLHHYSYYYVIQGCNIHLGASATHQLRQPGGLCAGVGGTSSSPDHGAARSAHTFGAGSMRGPHGRGTTNDDDGYVAATPVRHRDARDHDAARRWGRGPRARRTGRYRHAMPESGSGARTPPAAPGPRAHNLAGTARQRPPHPALRLQSRIGRALGASGPAVTAQPWPARVLRATTDEQDRRGRSARSVRDVRRLRRGRPAGRPASGASRARGA